MARKTEPVCPNVAEHTPCPSGYLEWHAWAEEMSKTHRQIKCSGCGRWSIWVPRRTRGCTGV